MRIPELRSTPHWLLATSWRDGRCRADPFARRLSVAFASIVFLSALGCGRLNRRDPQSDREQAPSPVVRVVAAELRSVQPTFKTPAVIVETEHSQLRPRVAATVVKRNITPGALVEANQTLYELDESDFKLALRQAQSRVDQAKATQDDAESEWKRAQQLKPQNAISNAEFDTAKARFELAAAQVEELQSKIDRAKLDLERTKIHAPFAGKISEAHYAKGDYVTPDSPEPLCGIVRLDPIYATAQVNQDRYIQFVTTREKLEGEGREIPDLKLRIELPTGVEYPHEGVFENWDNSAMATTGTIGGRVRFPNPNGLLLPGTNVTVRGSMIYSIDRVVIPQKAVGQDQQGHYVMVVGSDGVIERKNVDVGIRVGSDWAIRKGIEAGEQVVVDGLQKIRPGVKVQAELSAENSL